MDPKMAALKRLQAQDEEGGVAPAVAPLPPAVDQAPGTTLQKEPGLQDLLAALGGGLKSMASAPFEAVDKFNQITGGHPKLTDAAPPAEGAPVVAPGSVDHGLGPLKKPFAKSKRITREEE
jgi:hypothetical protein